MKTISFGAAWPRQRGKFWEALDRELGEARKNCGQIVAYGTFQPAAALHNR